MLLLAGRDMLSFSEISLKVKNVECDRWIKVTSSSAIAERPHCRVG